MFRLLRYLLEAVAAFVGVAIVLGLLLVWRLSAKPISSEALAPYIEAGIENIVPGSKAHLDAALLTWNGNERVIAVHVENMHVSDRNDRQIADIPSFDAKISLLGLVFGQFMPEDLTIDHPQIKIDHTKDGRFVFGSMDVGNKSNAPANVDEPLINVLRNLAQKLSRTALMHKLAITNAVFDVHDEVTQKDWSIAVPEISVKRTLLTEIGHRFEYGELEGHLVVDLTQKDSDAAIDVQYHFNPSSNAHSFSTSFNNVTPAFMAGGHPETLGLGIAGALDLPLTGTIKLTLNKNLVIDTLNVELHGDEGRLVDPDLWDVPCPMKSVDAKLDYDHDKGVLKVSDTHLDFEGPTLDLDITGANSLKPGQDMDFKANAVVVNMPMNSYGALSPKTVLPNPRYWLVKNMRDGTFTHGEVSLRGSLKWDDLANISIDEGSGKLSAVNGRITYVDGMPPAEGVNAEATFDLKKLVIQILSGGVGNIRMEPFAVTISGLVEADQTIDIPLQVTGPISDILELLNHPPMEYAKKLGIEPQDITGRIEGKVSFAFPLLRTLEMKDVSIHANANATGVASTKLVPGIAIDQGDLGLTLDMQGFGLKGQADLDRIPFHITWQESFEKQPGLPLRHAVITGQVHDDQWNNLGISQFNGSKGVFNVFLDMTQPSKTKMILSGTVDMGPAAVMVNMLNWKKAANVPAVLKFTTNSVGNGPVNVPQFSLRGPQIYADGEAVMTPDMTQFLSLDLSSLSVGRTNAAIHLTQSFGDSGSMQVTALGSALDITGLRNSDSNDVDKRPQKYSIHVNRLYTSDTGEIDDADGSAVRDQQGWSSIYLHGLADGDTPLSIELTPQPDGHKTLEISSDGFGKAMQGLGLTDTIRGGKLSITGESTVDNPRLIVGVAKISDFTVVKLPALALLLNALSPFGFTGILTDSADFSRFQGAFNWQGDTVNLTRAHAAGSAIGINIDGKVNVNTGDANLQGTLVPFSVVNKILDYIPIIGDIITGGEDQGVLAVQYEIKGNLNSPKISVNPISLLTPGFLRNLFFHDDTADEVDQ